ncbi:hypothetical protein TWF788_010592 [Orbilia oligospora]|uniref:Uncharacterized protein n=1 Tax=Orbilia oligospora TaxID=2813651 RepID=A0A7C8Q226_ORBOL|nr:hypothetical protein TWF788_010592 [Orbilia oligospora]
MAPAVAPTINIQIPQLAITDVDSSRPQTPVSMLDAESVPTSPTTKRMDSLKVDDIPAGWRRKRSSSISTMETLPTYSGPGSPTRRFGNRNRSNSVTPSMYSEAPSYRTIPEDHDSTVYHLYRIGGPQSGNMSIHEVADKSLGALPRATFADGSQRPTPGWWSRTCGAVNVRTARRPDHPKFDPRMAAYFVHKPTLPVGWKTLPYTLRVGPNRHSPISCRFDGSFAWRKWDFDFEDINGEGVVDERGVVAEDYPRKFRKPGWKKASDIGKDTTEEDQDEAEMLKEKRLVDPKTKSSCLCSSIINAVTKKMGERESRKKAGTAKSSKSTSEKPKDIIAPAPVLPVPAINITGDPLSDEEKGALTPKEQTPGVASKPTSTTRNTPALTIDTSKVCEITPPHNPSTPSHPDRVQMIWENKLGRQYSFTYKDIKFSWKGTSTLKDEHNKKWGALNRYSHLKLVAELPGETEETPVTPIKPKSPRSPCLSPDDAEKPGFLLRRKSSISSITSIFSKKSTTAPKKELVVATYTCTWGKRKAGRLHIDNTSIDRLVQLIVDASPVPFSPLPRRRSTSSFSGDHYLSPDSFSPPTKKRHAHVFPTPRLPESPVPVDVFERKRLRELTVVSCVAMANGEQEKRHAIIEMTALLAEIAQNVATG